MILGLSITSSWGNGHATTFRGLAHALDRQGHEVVFLERDKAWYRENRDLPEPPYAETHLYGSLQEFDRYEKTIRDADAVLIGSFVPDGVQVAHKVLKTARGPVLFYDIDTPATLDSVEKGECDYMDKDLIPRFDAYLSFTGGPTLMHLEDELGAQRAHPLYCSVDPEQYLPADRVQGAAKTPPYWLGYLGTYSEDRQHGLEHLLLEPARRLEKKRFIVAGPQYPKKIQWPGNVARRDHVPPEEHAAFYHSQRYTLNVTRDAMREAGYAPSVRLFEAASTATPVISDTWPGIEAFFKPGEEILLAEDTEDVLSHLEDLTAKQRRNIGHKARRRVLESHTPAHRARTLTGIIDSILERRLARV